MLAPVARSLAGLHGLGVVHGDVTPANVLLERTGRPLLADLGVASLAGEVPGQLYGTEGFVAPEVLDRGVLTSASDVYAVGALAWWCVTGSAPAPVALRRPLEELAPGLPEAWSETTRQALLGDPDARPTAAELAAGLLRLRAVRAASTGRRDRRDVAADPAAAPTRRHDPSVAATPRRTAVGTLREGRQRIVALAIGAAARRRLAMGGPAVTARAAAHRNGGVAGRRTRPGRAVAGGRIADSASRSRLLDRSDGSRCPATGSAWSDGCVVDVARRGDDVGIAGRPGPAGCSRLRGPGPGQRPPGGLAASGQSWQGVALTVVSARTVSHTPESGDHRRGGGRPRHTGWSTGRDTRRRGRRWRGRRCGSS